ELKFGGIRYISNTLGEFAPDVGFPTTGFVNAQFNIRLDNANENDYNWTSNADWVSVDNTGKVKFTSEPNNQGAVTITATPKTGSGMSRTYTFTIKEWYSLPTATKYDWLGADTYCNSSGNGYMLPSVAQFTNATTLNIAGQPRKVGHLWSEWGDLPSRSGLGSVYLWTSDFNISSHFYVYSATGAFYTFNKDQSPISVMCVRTL
ncbi:Ig-like domain-containing protein, partial [Morganella morganii]|nr:Ig-like domain-containing protein [Morganella morganii]